MNRVTAARIVSDIAGDDATAGVAAIAPIGLSFPATIRRARRRTPMKAATSRDSPTDRTQSVI
jgi:hypothetical protein